MKEFFDYFVSSNAIALAVAVIIFLVTVILLFRRLIPFTLTLFLLFVAVMSGIIISNHEIVRERLFSSKVKGDEVAVGAETRKKVTHEDNLLHSKEQIVEAFEQIMHGWCRNVQNETIKATANAQARMEQYNDKHDEVIAILQDINLKLDLQQDEIAYLKNELQAYKKDKQ